MNYVVAADAEKFLSALRDESVDLFLIDPPYFGIVREGRPFYAASDLMKALMDAVIATASDQKDDPWSIRARAAIAEAKGGAQ